MHDDGTIYGGWFVAGTTNPVNISYHLPLRLWKACPGIERETAPPWDGHTSNEVLERMMEWLTS
jgi:hypothetical protein